MKIIQGQCYWCRTWHEVEEALSGSAEIVARVTKDVGGERNSKGVFMASKGASSTNEEGDNRVNGGGGEICKWGIEDGIRMEGLGVEEAGTRDLECDGVEGEKKWVDSNIKKDILLT